MALTYEPIATTTLGSAASSITFSSIPSTYTDLRLVICGKAVVNTDVATIQFNSDTANNYSFTDLYGDGAGANSQRLANRNSIWVTAVGMSTIVSLITIDIFSYAGSTYKTALATFSNDINGGGFVEVTTGLWRSTSAINNIGLKLSNNWGIGTVATLYGIKSA